MANAKGRLMLGRWKRPQLQFRLSVLLLIVTVFCVWLGRTAFVTTRQSRAVKTITEAEGILFFDYQEDSQGGRSSTAEPPAPEWLRNALGEEYFRTPITVDMATNNGRRSGSSEPKATPEALAAIGELPEIQTLELSNNETVDDDALKWLSGLAKLRVLYLYHTSVTGSGLAALDGLPLQHLTLAHSPVTDEGLRCIGKLQELQYLILENTTISDHGLAHLADLPNLKNLELAHTDITDAGLAHLHHINSLESVGLQNTNVTAAGISRLAEAQPNCSITTNYGLGLKPDNKLLFPAGYQPTTSEIQAKLKEKNISFNIGTDKNQTGNPVISFRLEESTLGAEPILQLVEAMPELETLTIYKSLAGDTLLEGLTTCKRLNYLCIRDGRLSDDGLRHLQKVPSLREIVFHNQRFTDAAVEHLCMLRQLTQLDVRGSKLSDKGKNALQRALPNCRLYLW